VYSDRKISGYDTIRLVLDRIEVGLFNRSGVEIDERTIRSEVYRNRANPETTPHKRRDEVLGCVLTGIIETVIDVDLDKHRVSRLDMQWCSEFHHGAALVLAQCKHLDALYSSTIGRLSSPTGE
jgi:hypothetical protein